MLQDTLKTQRRSKRSRSPRWTQPDGFRERQGTTETAKMLGDGEICLKEINNRLWGLPPSFPVSQATSFTSSFTSCPPTSSFSTHLPSPPEARERGDLHQWATKTTGSFGLSVPVTFWVQLTYELVNIWKKIKKLQHSEECLKQNDSFKWKINYKLTIPN